MKDLNEDKHVILIDSIEHQGIGGKEFRILKEGTIAYFLDTIFGDMTIAETNFIQRRMDLFINEDKNIKIYYGHLVENGLGYFIAEDEIKEWQ